MSPTHLVLRTLRYHWRTNLAVVFGVAAAVSVLSGALLVGESVRGSLREIAVGRLGRTDHVISSANFFSDGLAARVRDGAGAGVAAAPLIVTTGFVSHEASGRRASNVLVYGVDERFWTFHRGQSGFRSPSDSTDVLISPALAEELGASPTDTLLVRLQKPSAIPVESLFGRKDDAGRTVRLDVGAVLARDQLGEFSLQPQQSNVRALFAPLARIRRALGTGERVNTVLVAGAADDLLAGALKRAVTLDDLGLKLSPAADPPSIIVESTTGILDATTESAIRSAAHRRNFPVLPVFTYLANTIRNGDRQVPYSLIAAVERSWSAPVTAGSGGGRFDQALPECGIHAPGSPALHSGRDWITLNTWTAEQLRARPGDRIEVDYFLWDPAGGLTTHTAAFTADCVEAPLSGLTGDRRLAPEYPGITTSLSLASWDPPFPVDFSRVRPEDEAYWKAHHTTPKAFISFARGRELWSTRWGGATSIRVAAPYAQTEAAVALLLDEDLRAALTPQSMGMASTAVRRRALEAARGTTDFGEYFTYFSFFIVASALLLAVLFFRLGIEQRLRQIGILRASGFTVAQLRRLLLAEALLLAIGGSALGMAGAVAYGRLMIFALRTWWVGAVGTTLLTLHVSWTSLLVGAASGLIAAAACVAFSLRAVARLSPRALLSAHAIAVESSPSAGVRRRRVLSFACGIGGLALLGAGFADKRLQTAMFFAAGALLLAACMLYLAWWLRAQGAATLSGRGTWALWRLGFRSAAFRPSRSSLSAALIASAAFIIVSVDAFRRSDPFSTDVHSGTGGFAVLARSEVPLLSTPNDAAGREALVVNSPEFTRIRFTRFRLRPGQDASCLNLYRPTAPTLIAPERGFIESGRFSFASSMADTQDERANPWLLLRRTFPDGAVPVIADATSLQYALHASVGDSFSMDIGVERPLLLRFVGALSDSVLQGELMMSEEHFVRLFPAEQGYRMFLVEDAAARTPGDADALAATLERELSAFGLDAVTTAERLASFHRVENTYLSTFQTLGGLGLLLGTIGLSAIMFRNVLERRRELALLRAVGYSARHVSTTIFAEAAFLLAAGLAAGTVCAALAVSPAWFGRGGSLPAAGLGLLLAGVIAAGLLSSIVAARAALRGNLLEALRAE